jgi:hypothetical protein
VTDNYTRRPQRRARQRHRRQSCLTSSISSAICARRSTRCARHGFAARTRRFIKGQKYTLLSRHDNLALDGKRSLARLLAANKRMNTACVLKEAFGQVWARAKAGRASLTTGAPAANGNACIPQRSRHGRRNCRSDRPAYSAPGRFRFFPFGRSSLHRYISPPRWDLKANQDQGA